MVRAGRGRPKTDDSSRATLHESYDENRTDTTVAEAVGMKQRSYTKVKKVYDTANDTAATGTNPRRRAAADGRGQHGTNWFQSHALARGRQQPDG